MAEGSLLDADALLATEEFNKASAENLLISSKLTLIQLMQLEGASDIAIETPALEIPSQESLSLSSESVYSEALKNLPEVKASELRLKSAKESLGIARAARYPRLSAFGSLSTNYSNQATSLMEVRFLQAMYHLALLRLLESKYYNLFSITNIEIRLLKIS